MSIQLQTRSLHPAIAGKPLRKLEPRFGIGLSEPRNPFSWENATALKALQKELEKAGIRHNPSSLNRLDLPESPDYTLQYGDLTLWIHSTSEAAREKIARVLSGFGQPNNELYDGANYLTARQWDNGVRIVYYPPSPQKKPLPSAKGQENLHKLIDALARKLHHWLNRGANN